MSKQSIAKSGKSSTPTPRDGQMPDHPILNFCRKLPHATEDTKWGKDLCFSIGGKMFCVFNKDNHDLVGFKTTPATFQILTKLNGIFPAAYAARFHWVSVQDKKALPRAALKELIAESYQIVAAKLPKKMRKELGIA